MRIKRFVVFFMTVLIMSGCAAEEARHADKTADMPVGVKPSAPATSAATAPATPTQTGAATRSAATNPQALQVSLTDASSAQVVTEAANRKIIRNAELQIEIEVPTDGLSKITAISESLGGFVVTSEMKQSETNQLKPVQSVSVIARIPSAQFNTALDRIRSLGNRVIHEKVAGQDVSEEYLDLEARIRTKKALEAQFLEIMKQANKVSEALEVQSQLADVRTEIERLEGRRRFLENQSAMSTITITLQPPVPVITATTESFGDSIRRAAGNSIDVVVSILLSLLRVIIIVVPFAVLLGVPGWFLLKALRRKFTLPDKAEPLPDAQQ